MEGTTAVVTGAGDGVGERVARAFADEGATVVACANEADAVEETVEAIERAGGSATGMRADVRDEFDLERLMETAARTGPAGIDCVVPAATTYHGSRAETPLAGSSYAAFDDTLRTNGRGAFATIREALPHLNADARILVPLDPAAREPEPGLGPYAVASATAEAVVRTFAVERDDARFACIETGGDDAAELFVWAAELAVDDLDGSVFGPEDRRRAADANR